MYNFSKRHLVLYLQDNVSLEGPQFGHEEMLYLLLKGWLRHTTALSRKVGIWCYFEPAAPPQVRFAPIPPKFCAYPNSREATKADIDLCHDRLGASL